MSPGTIGNVSGEYSSAAGDGTYTFTVSRGDGTIDPGTGATVDGIVQVTNPAEAFTLTPFSSVIRPGDSVTFTASGGDEPYAWYPSGGGSNPAMGNGDVETVALRIDDSSGNIIW